MITEDYIVDSSTTDLAGLIFNAFTSFQFYVKFLANRWVGEGEHEHLQHFINIPQGVESKPK